MIDFFEQFEHRPITHFGTREFKPILGFVLHYTGGNSLGGAIRWMQQVGTSAHFVIDYDGTIVQCVGLNHAAWHCGVSEIAHQGVVIRNLNRYTIGIELVNRGLLFKHPTTNEFFYECNGRSYIYQPKLGLEPIQRVGYWWESFPEMQLQAAEKLIELCCDNGISKNIWGHYEICVPKGRKIDPMNLDLERFRK